MKNDPNYYGFPGGRPKWPFARVAKPKPEPVTVPTMRRGVAILQLVAAGVDTNRAVASELGMKLTDSVAGPIAALDRDGYIARRASTGSVGRRSAPGWRRRASCWRCCRARRGWMR